MARHYCPEYEVALAEEQQARCAALIGSERLIAGIPVKSITPAIWDNLIVAGNSFSVGGTATIETIVQFLAILSPSFTGNIKSFVKKHLPIFETNWPKVAEEIDAFIDDVFMDADDGGARTPYYPLSISLCHAMANPPWYWKLEQTRQTDLRIIFMALRPISRTNGLPLINKRSDGVLAAATEEIDRRLKAGELTQKDIARINGYDLDEANEKAGERMAEMMGRKP